MLLRLVERVTFAFLFVAAIYAGVELLTWWAP